MTEVLEQRVVDAPAEAVARLLTTPDTWLEEAAVRAHRGAQSVEAKLRAEIGRRPVKASLKKRVRFEVGKIEHVDKKLVIPLTWQAIGFAGLFPVMDAVIELHRAGRDRTRLVFWGRYDPPLGRAGDLVDRFVAHEAAEASVRKLLELIDEKAGVRGPTQASPDGHQPDRS
jgi:hypothetical protein